MKNMHTGPGKGQDLGQGQDWGTFSDSLSLSLSLSLFSAREVGKGKRVRA